MSEDKETIDWLKLFAGACAGMSAPFAVHPLDQKRAKVYRDTLEAEGLSFDDAKTHFDNYANKQGWTNEMLDEQYNYFSKYMKRKY